MKSEQSRLSPDQIKHGLVSAQTRLNSVLNKYSQLKQCYQHRSQLGYDNNARIITILRSVCEQLPKPINHGGSLKPIELILRFIDDTDILNLASTCMTLYRLIYSPIGFTIIRSLRPIVVRQRRESSMPVFNKVYLQNLCSEVNLANLDEDDKMAHMLTMQTNLMAARQKMSEIQLCNQQWEKRKQKIREQIGRVSAQRHKQSNRIELLGQKIQKLTEMLKQSSGHIGRLKNDQMQMLKERQARNKEHQAEKQKLTHQKQLLIKKIKAQQRQREEAMVYTKQVRRITQMLNRLTAQPH